MTCYAVRSGGFFSAFLLPIFLISLIVFSPRPAFSENSGEGGNEDSVQARQRVEARYDQGKFYFNQLQDKAALAANRDNWLKCISIFQNIYLEDPNHSLAPASLYMICRARLQMFDRFHDARDLDEAIKQLQNLVNFFPDSRLADDALFALGQLYLDNKKDEKRAAFFFSRVVNEYPNGDMYALAAQKMQQLSQQFGIALPQAMMGSAPEEVNTIFPARHWSSRQYGRIVIGASSPVAYKKGLLPAKSGKFRLYIDFADAYLPPADRGTVTVNDDGLLRSITAAQETGGNVRVIVEADKVEHYETYSLPDPFRVVIDIQGKENKENRFSKKVPKPPPANIEEAVAKAEAATGAAKQQSAAPAIPSGDEGKKLAAATEAPKDDEKKTGKESAASPAEPATVTRTPAKTMPSGKSLSLAQQLGLGVKTIVLDPGHGGKDPGAIVGDLHEKDVVLTVAKRLKLALEKQLGCTVLLTRDDDRFLGLEERTAFANTHNADLFLSLHLNAYSSAKVHGFETYYLNLTTDRDAMRVAALENATSAHQLSDLQDILASIMKNSKIAESSRLARLVNNAVVKGMSGDAGGKIKNHGVKQAPFYVLIGAQMPAILLEMAFISNPDDAKRIISDDYVAEMAKHIGQGILSYINSNTASAGAGGIH